MPEGPPPPTARHSTAQHRTEQRSTAQRSTAQCSAAKHSTAHHTTPRHATPPHHSAGTAAQHSAGAERATSGATALMQRPRARPESTRSTPGRARGPPGTQSRSRSLHTRAPHAPAHEARQGRCVRKPSAAAATTPAVAAEKQNRGEGRRLRTFIQPEVRPPLHGDQVAEPLVGQLVRHSQRHVLSHLLRSDVTTRTAR